MSGQDPVVVNVEKSLLSMEETLRDQSRKMNGISTSVQEIQIALRGMAVQNDHYVQREDFIRLEGDLRASAKETARQEVVVESRAREKADDALRSRIWYVIGLVITVAVGLAIKYLESGGGP